MAIVKIETLIGAPIERCFDLARDIDFHVKSLGSTGERAVEGRTTGLIGLGESVTWEGHHLGMTRRFTSKITRFDRPRYFQDQMMKGAFASFVHDHRFLARGDSTLMTDVVFFRSPAGLIGALVDAVFMARYLRRLLDARARAIRDEAESRAIGPR